MHCVQGTPHLYENIHTRNPPLTAKAHVHTQPRDGVVKVEYDALMTIMDCNEIAEQQNGKTKKESTL